MSLRFRLISLVCVVLLISLPLGGIIAYSSASRSVRTEMRAALLVGRQTIENATERLQNSRDPSRDIDNLVASFNGNRHLRVRLGAAAVTTPVVERAVLGGVPAWFFRVVGVAPETELIPVTIAGHDYGTIVLETDPHNETLEVWDEFADGLVIPVIFCGLTILLIYVFIGRALRPLKRMAVALEEIGDGRYETIVSGKLVPELSRLRDSFNRMAARLALSDAENRRLNEELLTLQEQERGDLARDLHDDISPFLFAISVDAATARDLLREGRVIEASDRVQSIADAGRHMQRQVRSMLGRLRPIGLAEFGLGEAIENMVGFWRRRRPEIRYAVRVSKECENPGEMVGTTICRIVQEALSNAVRHAGPKLISVSVDRDRADTRVVVADDGSGVSEPTRVGYGLLGIKERVNALGGDLVLSEPPGAGFAVRAVLPASAQRLAVHIAARAAAQ
jgi:two-component system, NarL family, sensor histidine kinase UhpB